MSSHHLGKGSQLPAFNGKLRVYSMRFCPYAQRTILVLNAKKIPYEVVNVSLTEKPEWLTSKSPLGKVPVLEIEENVCLYESLITCEYIDDKYPLPQLASSDPLRKAQDKLIVENFNKVITGYYKGLMSPDDVNEETITSFFKGIDDLQKVIINRCSETKFLGGKNPGMVDYMIWPWCERFATLEKLNYRFGIDKSEYKSFNTWLENMKQFPAVRGHYLDPATHAHFYEMVKKKEIDYDFLL